MEYLQSTIRQFEYYKRLGEQTFAQVTDEQLFWQHDTDCNSIGTLVKHLAGNMLSRWTDFLLSDGEKPWRNRDSEFENDIRSREELLALWEKGWRILLDTLRSLSDDDLERIIFIRNEGHTVMEAINRQMAHYPYHVGQIVFIGKMLSGHWQSLSIPKGRSEKFNTEKFSEPKQRRHFTDGLPGNKPNNSPSDQFNS